VTVARHAGRVTEDGATLRLRSLPAWRATLARHAGRDVELWLTRVSEKASHDQHGYYRSTVLTLLAEEWGWGDPTELHHELKVLHLPAIIPLDEWPLRKIGAGNVRVVPSSADFTVEQYSAFLQAVLDQAADAGIVVPPPRGSR